MWSFWQMSCLVGLFYVVLRHARGCLLCSLQLNLGFVQTLGYVLVVCGSCWFALSNSLVVLNRLILGAFAWLPWRARNVRNS